ncbi:MAG: zinc-binding dehydrogenase [Raineya sp.]|nr:zinc-binding dehydrogenase [Raineya sp.]MDW8296860.1 zinc-binding dehydrogenase [Raineya sp.]
MKALVLTENEVAIQEVAIPEPQTGEVLVKVLYAALNRRDQWIRVGLYPGIKYGAILGSDACGIVEKVGSDVDTAWLGKKVIINPNVNWGDNPAHPQLGYTILGMPTNGTFAEYVCVPVHRLHEKPAHLTDSEAAALPLAALTAYRACFYKGEISKGKNVLITGAGGGVAQFAAQFACAVGANVWVTSSSEAQIQLLTEKAGVRGGVLYTERDWHKELLKKTNGTPFDVIIDSAGGNDFNLLVKICQMSGIIVTYGATLGTAKLDIPSLFFRQATIKGSTMGNDQEFADMVQFVAKHQIHPVVDSVRPFSAIIEALNDMAMGKIKGKIVIAM